LAAEALADWDALHDDERDPKRRAALNISENQHTGEGCEDEDDPDYNGNKAKPAFSSICHAGIIPCRASGQAALGGCE